MYDIWTCAVAVIVVSLSRECQPCQDIEPKDHHEKIPVFRDNVTATNFSFVARSPKEFELWWNTSCDSWNEEDFITFTFQRFIRHSNDVITTRKNFTSCTSNELLRWPEKASRILLNISLGNDSQDNLNQTYCYSVRPKTIVLSAPTIKRTNVNPTNMSFKMDMESNPVFFFCALKYKKDQSADSTWKRGICQNIECNMTDLISATDYLVMMACTYTLCNCSLSWSHPQVFSTPVVVPNEAFIRNVVTENLDSRYRRSVNVSWQPTSTTHQNGEMLLYTVTVQGKTCDSPMNNSCDTPTTSCIIHGLYYWCDYRVKISASNSAGTGTLTVLNVGVRNKMPSEARDFTVISISSKTIQLSWKDPERPYGEINYTLNIWSLKDGEKERLEPAYIVGGDPTYTVTGLTPFTTYHLNLVTSNHAMASHGIDLEETTSEAVPSEGPAGLTLAHVPFEVTKLSVRWEPVPEDQRNGNIVSYTIYWWQQGHSASCQPAPPPTASNSTVYGLSYIIKGLTDNTPYCVTVSAFTSVGEGPKASVKTIRTQRAAITVMNVTVTNKTSDSISLEWNLPEEANTALMKLHIHQNEVMNTWKLGKGRTSHTSRNLKPYTNYSLSVQACWDDMLVDNCGDNNTVYVRTSSTYPSEPTSFTIRLLSQDHVSLSWQPPLLSNGPISHYLVTFFQDAQSAREERRTEALSMPLTFACSTFGNKARVFVFHVAAVVDGLHGPAAKHNTTICIDPRVSDWIIALVVIPGFLICLVLSLICWYAMSPRKKIEIKHAKAIYEPKMVSSCGKAPEKEVFDTLTCQSPTKLETECETYMVMGPKKYPTLKTSTSQQSYIQMSRGDGY